MWCCFSAFWLRSKCSGVVGWDGESNECVQERFGLGVTAKRVNCGVPE